MLTKDDKDNNDFEQNPISDPDVLTSPFMLLGRKLFTGYRIKSIEVESEDNQRHFSIFAAKPGYQSNQVKEILTHAPKNQVVFAKRKNGNFDLKFFPTELLDYIDRQTFRNEAEFDGSLLAVAKDLGYKTIFLEVSAESIKTLSPARIYLRHLRFLPALLRKSLKSSVYNLTPQNQNSMIGAGVVYKRQRFITHTTLPHHESAMATFTTWQRLTFLLIVSLLGFGLFLNPLTTAITIVAILSAIYFLDAVFTLFVVLKSLHFPPEITINDEQINRLDESKLPVYSILCPLFREAKVLPQFVQGIESLDWPKNKLDVLLLLEENDEPTIEAARAMNLPPYFRIVIVPHSLPKTKPKACNYGLSMAKGEYVVVYDAEDLPEPLQLKKAYLAFQNVDTWVICLQAKLNYYNPHHNLLTRLFTAEYSLWFDVVLPGLQSIDTTIPLGGTSNHFRTADLLKLQGWDPFNVTEDCDLGARLFRVGYKTAIIDSTTLEEANSQVGNWLRQRSRWIKGYFQTYLVHMRNPLQFSRTHGLHALIFQLVIGARTTFMLINPILWAMTILYFAAYRYFGPTIESFYPTPVFYMAVFSLVFGNFLHFYNYMIGSAKRGHWPVIKYIFLIPFYWLLVSCAAVIAAVQLVIKPHFWEKTVHGFHLHTSEVKKRRYFVFDVEIWSSLTDKIGPIVSPILKDGGLLLIASSFIGNIFDFLYNAYLGRAVSFDDFGLISLVGTILFIARIPMSSLSRTVTYKSAFYLGKHKIAIKEFWSYLRRQTVVISLFVTALWLLAIPFLQQFFKSSSPVPFILFTPVWFIGAVSAVDLGFLSGNMKFKVLAVMAIIFSIARFTFSIVLVKLQLSSYVYAATPAAMTITFFIGWFFCARIKGPNLKNLKIEMKSLFRFPYKFFASSVVIKLSEIAFYTMDIVLVKHFLPPVEAGEYALISLVGKMVFFIGGLFSQFILPFVSHDEGANKDSRVIFYKLFLASTAVSLFAFVGVGLLGSITAPILFGNKILPVVGLLPIYAFAMFCFQEADNIVSYHQAKNKLAFAIVSLLLGVGQIIGLALYHANLTQVVTVMSVIGISNFAFMLLLHFTYDQLFAFVRDLIGLITNGHGFDVTPKNKNGLKILIFNWRDLRHVWAGGAEVYIHELAKRWVEMGHVVTVFCGNDGNSLRYETVDGVQIIRRGGFYLVYIWAILYYLLRLHGNYDVVIDSENGIPFFTPLYSRRKKFLLIHHVHQDVFRVNLRPPLSWIGKFLEKRIMPLVYRTTEVITVSPSSKVDVLDHHLTEKEPHVIYNGVDLKKYKPGIKSQSPLVLYIGRIRSHKSLHIFVYAAQKILEVMPKVKFVIAGEGQESPVVVDLIKKLHLQDKIEFKGRVSEEEKVALYQKAWVFVNPSLMEGWGITTIEANASGTPVVASNVSGLRDAVWNPHSGVLVPYGDVDAFSEEITKLITNPTIRERMSKDAVEWAKNFDWEKSAQEGAKLLKDL